MKKTLLCLCFLFFASMGMAQSNWPPPMILTSDPTGSCTNGRMAVNINANTAWICSHGWIQLVGGGGSGSVGNGSQFNPAYYNGSGTTSTVIGDPGFLLDPASGSTFPAPSGTGVGLDITGDAHSSNIQNWRLTGGGIGAWVDSLGGFHGTSGDFGSGLGQGCLGLYDPTGLLAVTHCGPGSNLAAGYEVDDPAVPSAGFLYFDGFQTTSWSPAPASASNGLSAGGQVICSTSTLVCTISAATFTLNGVQYSSPQTDVTLVADGSNPRIDTFYVGCTLSAGVCDGTNTGIANFIAGTPAGSPAAPSIDPTIELQVGFVTIATSGTHATVTNEIIYEDDAGPAAEWTVTATGAGINVAGSTGCYAASSKCIIGTAVTAGQLFKGVRGSGTVIPSSYNVLGFEIKSGATWPKAKCLNIAFYNSTTLVGNPVSFCNGSFAFNSTQTSTYQQIAIAASLFNATTAVDTIIFTATGGGAAFSWTVDHILLQSGITAPPPSSASGTVNNCSTADAVAYYGTTGTTVSCLASVGTSGWVLTSNGAGSAPTFQAASGGARTVTTDIKFDQCTPGQTTNPGNSFWSVVALTNWDAGHWEFVKNTAADIFCSVRIPGNVDATPAASVIFDLSANDSTAGHTDVFTIQDAITSSLNPQVGSLTASSSCTFTTTATAYANTTCTKTPASTIAANQILVVNFHQAASNSVTSNVIMQIPTLRITLDTN